jgi:hypothetical protein
MPIRDDTSTRSKDEIRVISPWAWLAAAVGFLVLAGLFITIADWGCRMSSTTWTSGSALNWTCTPFGGSPPNGIRPPKPLVVLLGIFGGGLFACMILLIGYVNGDARRRGMNRVLWTLLATFIPNGIGILLYFVLRKPRISTCPQCSALVEPWFGFCPQCRHSLNAVCPQCQRGVHAGGRFCPYCSAEIGTTVNA